MQYPAASKNVCCSFGLHSYMRTEKVKMMNYCSVITEEIYLQLKSGQEYRFAARFIYTALILVIYERSGMFMVI